jgi:UDP-glucuronate 4-epimerase
MLKKVLVTGAAGFIGFHLCDRLISLGFDVTGIDNINDYYDTGLKLDRLKRLEGRDGFRFLKLDMKDRTGMQTLFEAGGYEAVVNLAAQAGVRYSLKNPYAYIDSNISGFLNVLEGCRMSGVGHLVFASSSSVYGANTKMPFSTHDNVDHPVSLYAATKKANELMAHAYASMYNIPCTGLRFFTVYGPWGRPDMAYFLFTKAIIEGRRIDVFNHGKMKRDFTYIDDVVEGVIRVMGRCPEPDETRRGDASDPARSYAPYRIYNIGNNCPVELMRFIETLEDCIGIKAEKNLMPIQQGDVPATFADVDDLVADAGFRPSTPIGEGLRKFVDWYRGYYGA